MIDGSDSHYLRGLMCLRHWVIVAERLNGLAQIRVIADDGDAHYIAFPEPTYHAGIDTNAEYDVNTLRLSYESMVTPHTVYDYDLTTRQLTTRKVQQIPSGYDATQYVTERLIAPARDGVQVPVSVVYKQGFNKTGQAPLYLYGYGAYGHAIPPSFSTGRLSLLDRGFAFAIAHIRGGDDLGYHWYEEGKLTKRTNTFNDFVDVAQHLIEQQFTGPGRIAISGGRAGGELMGAVVNQAPELWGAVVAHVPFVDVLNTMLDANLPLTPIEWPEWGNPLEDPAAFELIQSYSPYDQVRAGAYPPMLVTAGLNDPRVTYWEPAKYVAKLRHLKTDDNLLLLKTNMGAGHSGKSGRFDSLYEVAEAYAFILLTLGVYAP
jgi:oligopeptidase B